MQTDWHFENTVVLVTGSSQGIGAAALQAFARAGGSGVLNYWPDPAGTNAANAAKLVQEINSAAGREAVTAIGADVTSSSAVQAMMDQTKARFGRLDVLVNNAAVLRDKTLAKMTDAEWEAVINTNLSGVYRVTKSALSILADGGRIISLASVAGQVGFFGQTNYAAAKAGVEGFTRSLAKELAKRRITVNAVAPGLVDTAMAAQIPPEAQERLKSMIPLGRMAQTADIVNAILFLASAPSGYITGQTLNVNGGWHA